MRLQAESASSQTRCARPQALRFMAGEAGLDVDAWAACMADPAVKETVAASGAAGGALDLTAAGRGGEGGRLHRVAALSSAVR